MVVEAGGSYDRDVRTVLGLLLLVTLAACGGGGEDTADVPDGVTFQVEQSRQDLKGRSFGLQVVNRGDKSLTISRAEITSGRLDEPSVYEGPAVIPPGVTTNLVVTMAKARCGTGIDATARVTYRVGEGDEVTSVVRPKDLYGSVALFMKRDCAERVVGDLRIADDFTVRGKGRDSVLEVGMTFTPSDEGGPVRVGPVEGTTLLKPARGTSLDHVLEPGSPAYETELEIVPNRCDVHVVAEDRTGAIMPLHVESKESGKAFFYLRFTEAQRSQIFDFIADHCGFGKVQDPLLAP